MGPDSSWIKESSLQVSSRDRKGNNENLEFFRLGQDPDERLRSCKGSN